MGNRYLTALASRIWLLARGLSSKRKRAKSRLSGVRERSVVMADDASCPGHWRSEQTRTRSRADTHGSEQTGSEQTRTGLSRHALKRFPMDGTAAHTALRHRRASRKTVGQGHSACPSDLVGQGHSACPSDLSWTGSQCVSFRPFLPTFPTFPHTALRPRKLPEKLLDRVTVRVLPTFLRKTVGTGSRWPDETVYVVARVFLARACVALNSR